MQKLLDFIKNSIIGRNFIYVFVSNFFCMQCFGILVVEQPLPIYKERQLFLCNSPSATIGLEFLNNDFNLSFEAGDTTKIFSKQNALFIDNLYHINFGDEIEIAIDTVARKIFCYKFLWDDSVLFSAFGGSLIVNELVCGDLARLAADNICISGMLYHHLVD